MIKSVEKMLYNFKSTTKRHKTNFKTDSYYLYASFFRILTFKRLN